MVLPGENIVPAGRLGSDVRDALRMVFPHSGGGHFFLPSLGKISGITI